MNIFQYKLIGQNRFNFLKWSFSTDSNVLTWKHLRRPLTNAIVYMSGAQTARLNALCVSTP